MALSRVWLLGVALGALVAGAARAQQLVPEFQFVQRGRDLVVKSHIFNPTRHHNTATETISASVSVSSDLRKRVDLGGFILFNQKTCVEAKPEYFRDVQRKTAYAIIRNGPSTGTVNGCGSVVYKFHDIYYELVSGEGVGSTDHFSATFVVPLFLGSKWTTNLKFNVLITP